MGLTFKRVDGVSVSSQIARLFREHGIKYRKGSGGFYADFGNGMVGVDIRHMSGDRYEVVPRERNKRFRVQFTSLWGGGEKINSFDTFYEADFFREQVHGRMLVW